MARYVFNSPINFVDLSGQEGKIHMSKRFPHVVSRAMGVLLGIVAICSIVLLILSGAYIVAVGLAHSGLHMGAEFVHGRGITDRDVMQLCRTPDRDDILMVDIDSPHLTDRGVVCVAQLRNLQSVSLRAPRISNKSMQWLALCRELRAILIESSHIGDAGVESFAGNLTLQELILYGSNVTDVGLRHIGTCANLEVLALNGSRVTDRGLPLLAANRRLRYLSLRDADVGDAGIMALAGMEGLEKLDVAGTRVTREGAAQLQQRLPRLTFVTY